MHAALLRAAAVLALAGCAAPATRPQPPAPAADSEDVSEVPPSVLAGRALFDLDCGDPAREARARCILVAMPAETAVRALLARVRSTAPGSDARLDALAVLAERGEPLEGVEPGEVVSMSLRDLSRDRTPTRGALLALDRLRAMGEAARPALREAAASPGAASDAAARLLLVLYGERPARGLREVRP